MSVSSQRSVDLERGGELHGNGQMMITLGAEFGDRQIGRDFAFDSDDRDVACRICADDFSFETPAVSELDFDLAEYRKIGRSPAQAGRLRDER